MPWLLVDLVLVLVGLAALGVCGLRLWRAVKALTREVGRAGEQVGTASDALARAQADSLTPAAAPA